MATGSAEWNRTWSEFKVSANINDEFSNELYHHLQVRSKGYSPRYLFWIFFLIVDLRERGTLFVLTYFMRHYFTGQIILEIILTI